MRFIFSLAFPDLLFYPLLPLMFSTFSMRADHLLALIVEDYPELSPAAKFRLEQQLKDLLRADRRDKLDQFQARFIELSAPQQWRSLADEILLNHCDLELGPSCPLPRRGIRTANRAS